MLRNALAPFGVDCQPEGDYVGDKRADIRVAYASLFAIPIEIKGEWHSELWSAVKNQLIPLYTTEKESAGFGVYLVLWFEGKFGQPRKDGKKKPKTPQELEERLQAH